MKPSENLSSGFWKISRPRPSVIRQPVSVSILRSCRFWSKGAEGVTEQEARALYAQGERPVVKKLLEQDARIRELETRSATDSRNSSKPPSTDGYHKPQPESNRKKTGRKPGGQKGHPGSTLSLSDTPDRVIPHPVTICLQCGLDLSAR
jgi:transposase